PLELLGIETRERGQRIRGPAGGHLREFSIEGRSSARRTNPEFEGVRKTRAFRSAPGLQTDCKIHGGECSTPRGRWATRRMPPRRPRGAGFAHAREPSSAELESSLLVAHRREGTMSLASRIVVFLLVLLAGRAAAQTHQPYPLPPIPEPFVFDTTPAP